MIFLIKIEEIRKKITNKNNNYKMEFWQKTHLILFSFMSLSEFDFLCCYDPHTNEENMVIAGMD